MMKNVQDFKELEPVITRMTGQNLKCYANATAHSWVALLTETRKLIKNCSNLQINGFKLHAFGWHNSSEYSPMPN